MVDGMPATASMLTEERITRSWIPTWYQRMGADCTGLTAGRMQSQR